MEWRDSFFVLALAGHLENPVLSMKITREELLRQKACAEKQLQWIQEKLDELEREAAHSGPDMSREGSDPATIMPEPPAASVADAPGDDRESLDREARELLAQYGEASTLDPRKLKMGCITLVLLLSAMGLFFFLGLPYLIR